MRISCILTNNITLFFFVSTDIQWIFLKMAWQLSPILFSQQIHPHCLVFKKCQSGKHKGKEYQIVSRHMTSLRAYQFPLYIPYTEQEKQLFFPQPL